jgi:hypothetical protein
LTWGLIYLHDLQLGCHQREMNPRRQTNLRHRHQAGTQFVEICAGEMALNFSVGAPPDWCGAGEQVPALCGQNQSAAAAIVLILLNADKAAALERLEGRGERGAVHGQQVCHRSHRRRLGPVQRHEQRKLPVGKPQRAEGLVETAGQSAGRALHVQAEAMVPYKQCSCVRKQIGA